MTGPTGGRHRIPRPAPEPLTARLARWLGLTPAPRPTGADTRRPTRKDTRP